MKGPRKSTGSGPSASTVSIYPVHMQIFDWTTTMTWFTLQVGSVCQQDVVGKMLHRFRTGCVVIGGVSENGRSKSDD
jgi:hypothetical protein